jgi:hypothetical protein
MYTRSFIAFLVIPVVGFGSLRGDQSLLELIQSDKAPHPTELSDVQRKRFVDAAKAGLQQGHERYKYEIPCISFLIEAGDKETVLETLSRARDYNNYRLAAMSWDYFERSKNPDLLAILANEMIDKNRAGVAVFANGEALDVPSSTRAAMATLSIIANSKVFSPEVTEWAVQKRALDKQNNQFEALRESARAFSSHNLKALQEGRYSDAVVPPNPAQSSLPHGATSSPEAVEGQPPAEVPAVDANALSGSPANSPPRKGTLQVPRGSGPC